MNCLFFEISACIEDGNFAIITYSLHDEDGNDISAVDKLEYKLSDGVNTLIDWTEIIGPTLPDGEIKIPGSNNRIADLVDRYLTIHANYNTGADDSFKTIRYQLKDSPNTTTDSPT